MDAKASETCRAVLQLQISCITLVLLYILTYDARKRKHKIQLIHTTAHTDTYVNPHEGHLRDKNTNQRPPQDRAHTHTTTHAARTLNTPVRTPLTNTDLRWHHSRKRPPVGETSNSRCRLHKYSVSTTPAHHRNFVLHSFFYSTYCRKIDKKIDDDITSISCLMTYIYIYIHIYIYICLTAPLTSRSCILYIYSTNICTEYFKLAAHSQFFPL